MRHFAHHIGDYAAATAHLSFVEDAAYHRLLRLYYRDERPLPAEVAACRRLVGARSKEERAAVETVLSEFFSLGEDGWHQTRADGELTAYRARADIARENGRAGGRPATGKKPKDKPSDNQVGYSTEPSRKLTNSQGEAPTGLLSEEDQTSIPVAARESADGAHTHEKIAAISTMKRVAQ